MQQFMVYGLWYGMVCVLVGTAYVTGQIYC